MITVLTYLVRLFQNFNSSSKISNSQTTNNFILAPTKFSFSPSTLSPSNIIPIFKMPQQKSFAVSHLHQENMPLYLDLLFLFHIQSMKFEEGRRQKVTLPPRQLPQRQVILIADNRNDSKNDKLCFDYRSSAFKETEIDPLEERQIQGPSQSTWALENLVERVTKLQRRLQDLERSEGRKDFCKGRKRRRCFQQMDRNIQCSDCGKRYGSETALKYHLKLKHPLLKSPMQN